MELTGLKASDLAELLEIIKIVDGSSIYYHTHHYFRQFHFLFQQYSSDFAYWVYEILQERSLGEKLASLDLRDFSSIRSYREKIVDILEKHLTSNSNKKAVAGMEFHFCKSKSVVLLTRFQAQTLEEFETGLSKVDLFSIYYHFMESRLRTENPNTNDFSDWIEKELALVNLAEQIKSIDPYAYSLEEIRQRILRYVNRELYKDRIQKRLATYEPLTGIGKTLQQNKFFLKLKSRFKKDNDKTV